MAGGAQCAFGSGQGETTSNSIKLNCMKKRDRTKGKQLKMNNPNNLHVDSRMHFISFERMSNRLPIVCVVFFSLSLPFHTLIHVRCWACFWILITTRLTVQSIIGWNVWYSAIDAMMLHFICKTNFKLWHWRPNRCVWRIWCSPSIEADKKIAFSHTDRPHGVNVNWACCVNVCVFFASIFRMISLTLKTKPNHIKSKLWQLCERWMRWNLLEKRLVE